MRLRALIPRVGLRWRILSITVIPIVSLVLGALWMVNRDVSSQVHANLHEDLRRASAVLENLLELRAREITVTGKVIALDPKFFSVLTIPGIEGDDQVRATVSGVARDFNALAGADLFEVLSARGVCVASVGRDASRSEGRTKLAREALAGRTVNGILVEPGGQYQVAVTPVFAGGRIVGALLLGSHIGEDLVNRLREMTRSQVTFLSGTAATTSTLEHVEEREAVALLVQRLAARSGETRFGTVLELETGEHRYVTLVRRLPLSQPGQAQSYVMQRSVDAETLFLRDVQRRLAELGLVAILVALGAGFLIARRITAPVRRLVRGAEEMERGNYEYPLEVTGSDEIGVLASRFEVMRGRQREVVRTLEETTRLKSEFINVASHELRTPITVIRGFHELMAEGVTGPLTAEQAKAVEAIGQSLHTLERIAEDTTRMAQIEDDQLTLHREMHEVEDLVKEAVETALGQADRRRVRVEYRVEEGLAPVSVDGPRLTQAIANLVANGIRFTPDGGRVEVRAGVEALDLVVAVADTGVGIAPEKQSHVFDRSFLLRDSRHHHSSSRLEFNSAGLGLGLAITRGIAEAHGGSIRLESEPGRGSTFTLRLPVVSPGEMMTRRAA